MRNTIASKAVALSATALTVGLAWAASVDQFGIDDSKETGYGRWS